MRGAAPRADAAATGPIEQLRDAVIGGELPLSAARQRASSSEVLGELSSEYVVRLAAMAEGAAREGAGQAAVVLADLLATAASAARDAEASTPDAEQAAQRAVLAYIDVAHVQLISAPDRRLFHRALTFARQQERTARAKGDTGMLRDVLHRLGTLYLDPYSAGRMLVPGDPSGYEDQHRRWLLKERDVPVPGAEAAMPEPLEALHTAEDLLREAAVLSKGYERGRVLKAQADAMIWRRHLGDSVDEQEIVSVLESALAELEWEEDPQLRLTVLNALRMLGREPDPRDVDRVFERSLDAWLRGLGPVLALDLVRQAYLLLRDSRPRDALRLLDEARPIAQRLGEEQLTKHLRSEITMLGELGGEHDTAASAGGFDEALRRLEVRCRDESWDVERLFGAAISLVGATSSGDEEESALALMPSLRAETATLLAGRHAKALDWLTAVLEVGTGVNNVNRGAYSVAIERYSRALRSFLGIGLAASAEEVLARAVDLVEKGRGGADIAVSAVEGVAPSALVAERVIGQPAAELLQRASRRILGTPVEDLDAQQALFVTQVSKGLRFATALSGGSRYSWTGDETGRRLLDAIADAEATAEVPAPDAWTALDEDALLHRYSEETDVGEDTPADEEPAVRLTQLRRRYDSQLWEQLLRNADVSEALWLQLADVQAALDERTALVSYFLGAVAADGSAGTWVMVVTRSGVRTALLPGGAGATLSIGPAREAVQRDPASGQVSLEGERALAEGWERFLGAGELLEGLAEQGIDHLCVVPHGPLHYYPLHLAGPAGEPLADRWIVTYLPNLHLFVSRRGRPAVRRFRGRQLSSIGLSFEDGNPHGLPPLRGAGGEAVEVAGCFGLSAVLEAQATESALREALQTSRMVHLATHGSMDVDAPAFQCLYLTPDERSDGCLRAYELLSMDLRGLDLVTLSACETALGRFDGSDNLRGLPAALLLSGVSSLIGTLWAVEDRAARRFFTTLYERLHDGDSCLDAFHGAQRATRAEHPQYRDWGAFYLAGEWNWSGG